MHEQEMASHSISNAPLPQGFSVYQPALGAQLQFFPALGSRELDDLLNAFIPGPSSMTEKRASVSLDFLEFAQLTGRNFKFYTISPTSAPTSVSSPVSTGSPFNISPSHFVATWQFPGASGIVPVSPRPSFSTQTGKSSKASGSPSHGRPATDLSHLPGMKIMTKDGLDVTNSASRGSKTKEQRDHAHLMRIIKACDNCRRKKIRCDPSHKKRPSSQAQSPRSPTKAAKRARTTCQKPPAADIPAMDLDAFTMTQSSFPFDSTFTFANLQSLDPLVGEADPLDPWDQFVQYPPLDADSDDQPFFDLERYISSQSPSSSSQTSDSPVKSLTPLSDRDSSQVPGALSEVPGGIETRLHLPYLDSMSSFVDYTDFNLFSPGSSSFLEEESMIPVSRHRQLNPAQFHSNSSNENDPGSGLGSPAGILSGINETSRRAIRTSGDMIPGAPPGVSSSFQSCCDPFEGTHIVIQELPFANASQNNELGRFAPESSWADGILAPTAVIWGDSEMSPGESARQCFLAPQGIGARGPSRAATSPTRNGSHLTMNLESPGTSDDSSTQCLTRTGGSPLDQTQLQTRQAMTVFCLTTACRLPEMEQQRASATPPGPDWTPDGIAAASVLPLDTANITGNNRIASPDLASSNDRQPSATATAAPAGETPAMSTGATRSATWRGQETLLCRTRTSSSRSTDVSKPLWRAQRKLPACAMTETPRSSEGSTRDCVKPNVPQAAPLLATALIIMVLGSFARIPLLQFVAAILLAGAVAHACIKHAVISYKGCELSRTAATSITLITRLVQRGPQLKDNVCFSWGF